LGLFAEQVDPLSGLPAGNFPSTSAHMALVNASLYVGAARGRVPPHASLVAPLVPPQPSRRHRAA
jgi:hypothetical protein